MQPQPPIPPAHQQQLQQHHIHCSYERDIACDEAHHYHPDDQQYHHYPYQPHPDELKGSKPHSHHQSPHSHHSHSLHSSPHQNYLDRQPQHQQQQQCHESGEHDQCNGGGGEKRQHVSSSSSHHHHNHHRRRKRHYHHNGGTNATHTAGTGHGGHPHERRHHESGCPRRHRSVTDVSTTSINTCHESCPDKEVQEILVRRQCCSSSRTELAQYFAEDLYGSSSRRPSSCCTSSDYCYHTDSTSLYGSRSSLSRNNSIKSGSEVVRKRTRTKTSYSSLRALNASQPNSQFGSLTSIFNKPRGDTENGKMVVSPSKVTIEHKSGSSSKDGKELPDYACSPSPIRWSFLADGRKTPSCEYEGAYAMEHAHSHEHSDGHHGSGGHKCHGGDSPLHIRGGGCGDVEYEQSSNTVVFHQEGEAYNNCCNNYVQCNSYIHQDLQITSEDIHEYLSKGVEGEILNNSKNYPFQPSNALEFQYTNNFSNNNPTATAIGSRRNSSKETNLNQNPNTTMTTTTTPLSPTNINLSSSSNNINIVFNSYMENSTNANEVKFINTSREDVVSAEAHHSGYLPYTFPTYDYTNMSSNSLFDKPLGIDEIPNGAQPSTSASSSDHNLLAYRYSHVDGVHEVHPEFSPTSPSSSSISSISNRHRRHHHHNHFSSSSHHRWQHVTDNLKIGNAFKRVRKRARKCAEYLKKK